MAGNWEEEVFRWENISTRENTNSPDDTKEYFWNLAAFL